MVDGEELLEEIEACGRDLGEDLFERFGLFVEREAFDDLFPFFGDVFDDVEAVSAEEAAYLFDLVSGVVPWQERFSENQFSKNHPSTPDVNSTRVLRVPQQQFRSPVPPRRHIRTAGEYFRVNNPGQPKITNFNITILIHQQIPWFLHHQQITRSRCMTLDLCKQFNPSKIWNMKNFQ